MGGTFAKKASSNRTPETDHSGITKLSELVNDDKEEEDDDESEDVIDSLPWVLVAFLISRRILP
jgi:hypothetical protein